MKKILGLTVAALLIIATVGFGTWAYFSDTETSQNNAIVAGTLDLTLTGGSGSPNYSILTGLTNKAPGDSGSLYATIKNIGSLVGELDMSTGAVTNTGGSGGTEFEDSTGDLGGVAQIVIWIDVDKSTTFTDGDIILRSNGTLVTRTAGSPANLTAYYDTVNNYASKSWGGSTGIKNMATNDEHYVYVSWQIPTSAGNNIQGDSFSFTITFILEQPAAD